MYYAGRQSWPLQLLRQHIREIARHASRFRDSFHGVPKNATQFAGCSKGGPRLGSVLPDLCQSLHLGRRSKLRLREPLGKFAETLQEIGARPREDNLCVTKSKDGSLATNKKLGIEPPTKYT